MTTFKFYRKYSKSRKAKITRTLKKIASAYNVPARLPSKKTTVSKVGGLKLSKFIGSYRQTNRTNIPVKNFITHFYHQTFSISPGTTGAGYNTIYANSVYNPTDIVADHQPYGRDEMVTFFSNYRVHYCEIELTILPGGALSTPVALGVITDSDGTIPNSLDTKIERARGKDIVYIHANQNMNYRKIKIRIDPAKYWNTDMHDEKMQAASGASPVNVLPVVIWCQALDQSTTNGPVTVQVTADVKYYTEWFTPLDIAGS